MSTSQKPKVGAVIAAAGSSERMYGIDKVFALLDGQPILARVIDVFQKSTAIDQIVVILSEHNLEAGRKLVADCKWSKVTDICPGGARRQDSVLAGINHLHDCTWVVIHDGARPLVTVDLIEKGLEAAADTGAAIAAVPVVDTIKLAGADGIVVGTPPRQNLWSVQTPQIFRFDIITRAYRQSKGDVTDDAMLVEQLGYKVKLYPGSYDNIKVTAPHDLIIAKALLQKHEE